MSNLARYYTGIINNNNYNNKDFNEYTNCEYADMNFVYEMCNGNASASAAISKSQTSGRTGFHKNLQ